MKEPDPAPSAAELARWRDKFTTHLSDIEIFSPDHPMWKAIDRRKQLGLPCQGMSPEALTAWLTEHKKS